MNRVSVSRYWRRKVILLAFPSSSPHISPKSPTSIPFLFVRVANCSSGQLLPGPVWQSGSAVIPSLILRRTNFSALADLSALQDNSSKMIRPPIGETWDLRHLREWTICVVGRCVASLITSRAVIIGAISPSCTLSSSAPHAHLTHKKEKTHTS